MSRPRRWSDLLGGIAALVAAFVAAAAVLLFARVGALHGRTFHLYATVGDARGLSAGSEVWIGGQRVGVVHAIRFRPVGSDTAQPLLLDLRILSDARSLIRRDATVDVHPGGNLIGAPVVGIAFRPPSVSAVADGDTLHAARSEDMDRVKAQFASATAEAPAIIANLKVLASQLHAASGTLGALGIDGPPNAGGVARSIGTLRDAVARGDGTVGLGLRGGPLEAKARHAIAAADSVRALLTTSDATSLGRFRRDSTLFGTIDALRTELAVVSRQMSATSGSIGRLQQDSALAFDLARTHAALTTLMNDVKRHPLRYITISTF